jgi:hypothetical protein
MGINGAKNIGTDFCFDFCFSQSRQQGDSSAVLRDSAMYLPTMSKLAELD